MISHRSSGRPLTVEGGIVRVADALDMAKGRSRVEFEAGRLDIHSISAYAIDEVRIEAGDDKAVRVEIEMSNSAGIFQVDEGLGKKLRGTPLAEHIEVIARIEGEHEKRLVPVFRSVMRALVWRGVEEWLAEHAQVDLHGRRRPGYRRATRRRARALPSRVSPRRAQRLDHAASGDRGVRRGVAALADPRARRRGPLDGQWRATGRRRRRAWTAISPSRR